MHDNPDPLNETSPRTTLADASRDRVVIDVADVEPATMPVAEVPYRSAIDAAIVATSFASLSDGPTPIEACSDAGGRLIPAIGSHPVVEAVHLAYANHMPLVLSPDIMWLLVAHGVAHHVNANAESLRHRFVRHQGQARLEVRRDQFRKGDPSNDWSGAIDEFALFIRQHIGEATHALLEPRFSTTGAVEKTAAQIVLMDAMQRYFDYTMTTLCGIPQVVLEGTPHDWTTLSERIEALRDYELTWWVDSLRPILDEFVAAAGGAATPAFWRKIYKRSEGSGGPYISGWITAFFPYLRDESHLGTRLRESVSQNDALRDGGTFLTEMLAGTGEPMQGLTSVRFPNALSEAPFDWVYFGDRQEMRFAAGFVGVRQDTETLSVRPEIGWAVYDPAQIDAVRAQREKELAQLHREERDRAFARAAAWSSKARCQRCGEWLYAYGVDPPRRHCDAPVVDVSYR